MRPEILDSDVVVLDFNSFTPNDLRTVDPSNTDTPDVKLYRQHLSTYIKRSTEYWQNMETTVNKINLASRCRGVYSVEPSPSQRFLCIGTAHGDIFVYDLWMIPWRVVYLVQNESKGNDSVVDISWSLDSTRIICVNLSGTLNVWTFGNDEISASDSRKLDLAADDDGVRPRQLSQLLSLDTDNKDFMFQQGSHAEQNVLDDNYGPTMAAFFPCLSFFGTQNSVCVVLDSGDVLKCDTEIVVNPPSEEEEKKWKHREEENYSEPLWEAPKLLHPTILDESTGVNLLGKQVEAELLRAHKHPLIYLGFVGHVGSLVTVDQKGFIYIWKYQRSQLCGLGWYIPSSKYKLQMWEITYMPASAKKPNIVFTDKIKAGAKTQRTRQDIARERQTIQNTIVNMQLGDPWHEEYLEEQDLITKIYAPKGEISEAGAMFHVVIWYAATDQVSTYLTRMYKPVRVKATKLLQVIRSPSGEELIFLLLFPEYPPKSAHVMIVILDLQNMKLRDYRRNIPLTDADYMEIERQGVISADVSKVYGPTGSDYLFLMFKGSMKAISLTTGHLILLTENLSKPSGFTGCIVDAKKLTVANTSEVRTIGTKGKLNAVVYDQKSSVIHTVHFKDENTDVARRQMWKSYQACNFGRRVPVAYRTDPVEWTLEDMEHPAAAIRALLLECMDNGLKSVDEYDYSDDEDELTPSVAEEEEQGEEEEEEKLEIKDHRLADKMNIYDALESQFDHVNIRNIIRDDGLISTSGRESERLPIPRTLDFTTPGPGVIPKSRSVKTRISQTPGLSTARSRITQTPGIASQPSRQDTSISKRASGARVQIQSPVSRESASVSLSAQSRSQVRSQQTVYSDIHQVSQQPPSRKGSKAKQQSPQAKNTQ